MKSYSKRLVWVVVVLLAVCVYTSVSFAAEGTAITGEVFVQQWNDKDVATAATITNQNGEEYWIVDNAVGKELFKLDMQTVKATGTIGKTAEGKNAITVSKYELVPIAKETEEPTGTSVNK